MFACTTCGWRPCSANSREQKDRPKKPRSSSFLSSSTINAPDNFVSRKIMPALKVVRPVKVPVDLLGANQIFELLQSRESAIVENLRRQIDPLKELMKLADAFLHITLAFESRQTSRRLLERNAIAAIIGTIRSKTDVTSLECFADDLSNLTNSIIL